MNNTQKIDEFYESVRKIDAEMDADLAELTQLVETAVNVTTGLAKAVTSHRDKLVDELYQKLKIEAGIKNAEEMEKYNEALQGTGQVPEAPPVTGEVQRAST